MFTDTSTPQREAEYDQLMLVDGVPVAISPRQRDAMLQIRANLLREHIEDVCPGTQGVALRFPGSGLAMQQCGALLADFVRLVRLREPSLHLSVELEPDDGPLWLRVDGDRAAEFVRVVFTLP